MKAKRYFPPLLVVSLFALTACSDKTNADAAGTSFSSLQRFQGKAPSTLLTDKDTGPVLKRIVPDAQRKCLDDAFNYMPDLVVDNGQVVHGMLDGSHASNFWESYVSVAASGEVYVLLQCQPGAQGKAQHMIFTNADIKRPLPKPVRDLILDQGNNSDLVIESNGKSINQMAFGDFANGGVKVAANPPQNAQKEQGSDAPPPQPVQRVAPVQQQRSYGDQTAAYADQVANALEQSPVGGCRVFASNIRMIGHMNTPAQIRERQIDGMLYHVPRTCLPN